MSQFASVLLVLALGFALSVPANGGEEGASTKVLEKGWEAKPLGLAE